MKATYTFPTTTSLLWYLQGRGEGGGGQSARATRDGGRCTCASSGAEFCQETRLLSHTPAHTHTPLTVTIILTLVTLRACTCSVRLATLCQVYIAFTLS